MKRYLFFIVLIIFLFSFIPIFAEEISLNSFEFSIKPETIQDSTLIPIKELEDKLSLSFHRMEDDKFLLIFEGRFYLLNIGKNDIKIEGGEVKLQNKVLLVNEHLLVPVEFLKLLPGVEITSNGEIVYNNNFSE